MYRLRKQLRLNVIGEDFECGSEDGVGETKLFDERINIENISTQITVLKMACITATFSVYNGMGHLESAPLSINMNKGTYNTY